MIHEILPVGQLQCNCSILGDETSREAIVVDPGADIPRILAVLAKHQLTLQRIVITHAHIDHIAGAAELKRLTGAPILYNQADLPLVAIMDVQAGWLGIRTPEVAAPDQDLPDGATVQIQGITAHVHYTPGHTPGSICLHLPEAGLLLAGDTLFHHSIGRTDLPGGDHKQLIHSIRTSLLSLPEMTIVIPGHGGSTSIGEERENNPFLQDA
jgi:glyoxylase-like metal-dependent hydrolase (beta-lactamase superfamily II)